MEKNDQLYLWGLDKEGKLNCKPVERVANRGTSKYIYYRVKKTDYRSREIVNIDRFINNTVLSYSNDETYIWNIVSIALFKDFIKKQEAYLKSETRYTKFREANPDPRRK